MKPTVVVASICCLWCAQFAWSRQSNQASLASPSEVSGRDMNAPLKATSVKATSSHNAEVVPVAWQSSSSNPSTNTNAHFTANPSDLNRQSQSESGKTVRDPVTGRMYYQQWVTESVPVTRWENKQVTTTVYETQWVQQVVPMHQVVYQAETNYQLQPRWKGVWNPFQQPTLAYESKPVTRWVPKVVTTHQVRHIPKVVPKQQTITVPYPVTEVQTQQRLVQTEIPQQPINPTQNFGLPPNPNGQQLAFRSTGSSGQPVLRSIQRTVQNVLPTSFPAAQSYQAQLRTASGNGGSWNVMQAGMSPTVLR